MQYLCRGTCVCLRLEESINSRRENGKLFGKLENLPTARPPVQSFKKRKRANISSYSVRTLPSHVILAKTYQLWNQSREGRARGISEQIRVKESGLLCQPNFQNDEWKLPQIIRMPRKSWITNKSKGRLDVFLDFLCFRIFRSRGETILQFTFLSVSLMLQFQHILQVHIKAFFCSRYVHVSILILLVHGCKVFGSSTSQPCIGYWVHRQSPGASSIPYKVRRKLHHYSVKIRPKLSPVSPRFPPHPD